MPTSFDVQGQGRVILKNQADVDKFAQGFSVSLTPGTQDTTVLAQGSAVVVSVRGTMDTISFYGSGASARTGSNLFQPSTKTPVEPTPVRLRWLVIGGSQCVIDPSNIIAVATTTFISEDDMKNRSGLIFRLTGFNANTILLLGYRLIHTDAQTGVVESTANINVNINGEADLRGSHRLDVEVGNYTS